VPIGLSEQLVVGDVVDGLTITNLALFDPIAPGGHVVVRAATDDGVAFLRLVPNW